MKDEIKEILDKRITIIAISDEGDSLDITKELSDYITNLQEENKKLKGRLEEINCLIHKALNDREINGIGNLNLNMILELSGEDKE